MLPRFDPAIGALTCRVVYCPPADSYDHNQEDEVERQTFARLMPSRVLAAGG